MISSGFQFWPVVLLSVPFAPRSLRDCCGSRLGVCCPRGKGDFFLPGILALLFSFPTYLLPSLASGLLSWFETCPPPTPQPSFISIQAKVEKKTEAATTAGRPEPNAVTKSASSIASAQRPPAGKVSFIQLYLSEVKWVHHSPSLSHFPFYSTLFLFLTSSYFFLCSFL